MCTNARIPVAPGQIDYVLLTHAHIDHSGLLPLLYAGGFNGEIHTTEGTASLCNIMLRDSAHIQEFEAEWRSRKAQRNGSEPYVPLYTMSDAIGAIELLRRHRYDEKFQLCEGVEIRFTDAGHLLGSRALRSGRPKAGKHARSSFPATSATSISRLSAIHSTSMMRITSSWSLPTVTENTSVPRIM